MKANIQRLLNNWKIKWLMIFIGSIVTLAIAGYMTILYGGKLIVNEEKLILPASTTIETVDGHVIGEIYDEKRYPVSIDQIPEHVKEAFIAIEDRRFYKHGGVDFRSVTRAVYRDIISRSKVEGASTITQQLAKNLFLENDKTWMRKTKEVMAAIYLEREFSKDYILELYLNKIYFGDDLYGVEAASKYFFSKSVQELSVSEGAMLAGLIQSPNHYFPVRHPERALERRNVVLRAMERAKRISTENRMREQGKTLGLDLKENERVAWNNSYIDLVMKEAAREHQLTIKELKRGGYRLIVNIDESIQKVAYESFQNDDYFPGNTKGVEGAFVMVDGKTGRIVSALGGRQYELGNLNRVTVKRQPGSTIKPLAVYGPAMMKEEYHPYTLLKDELIDYDGYPVSNIDGEYSGVVSMYEAMVKSKNAPAVWLLNELGIDYAKTYLDKMHMNIDDQGLAIALGGLSEGITPIDVVRGFSTFANEGKALEPYTIERIYDQEGNELFYAKTITSDVFSPQVAWNMTEILQYTVKEGTARHGDYQKALAGKTGSTEHPHAKGMVKDAWFASYTPEYVTALWMGYDQSDADHYLTAGSLYPTKLTKDILSKIDETTSLAESFIKPDHVKALQQPIELVDVKDVSASYVFGGFSLVKGKLTWKSENDNRVVYRIYRQTDGMSERVGEVIGEHEFVVDDVSLFRKNYFYIVPYDPNTKLEGNPSEIVELSL